ncbi:unnamed protein product [Symbiodinium natans]|uniref:Uncharacterized protein n=1 Tax=Symbiodinium natans TaxID=878477 RepID=A0A812PQL7_9DINO|nr:unnamed protein product [Symbiodinium natans]
MESMEDQAKRQSCVEADLQAVRHGVQDLAERLREEQLQQQRALCRVEQQISELRALMARPAEATAPAASTPEVTLESDKDWARNSLEGEVRALRLEMDAMSRKISEEASCKCTSLPNVVESVTEGPLNDSVAISNDISEIRNQIVEVVRFEQEAFRDRYLLEASNCAESVKNLELTMGHVSRELQKLLQKVGQKEAEAPAPGVLCSSNKTTLQGASFLKGPDASPASPGEESNATALGGMQSAATCSPREEPAGGSVQWSKPSRPSRPSAFTSVTQPVNVAQDVPSRCAAPAMPPQYSNAQPTNVWRRSLGNPSIPAQTPPPPSAPIYFRSRSHEGPTPSTQERVVIATKMTSPVVAQEQTTTPMKSMPRMVATPQMVKDPFREAGDAKLPIGRATIAVPFARDWKGQAMPQLSMAVRSSGVPAAPLMRVTQVQTRVG